MKTMIEAAVYCVLVFLASHGAKGNVGKEFVLGFMKQNINEKSVHLGMNSLYITSKHTDAFATIEVPFLNRLLNYTLKPNATNTISLPSSVRMASNDVKRQGIRITSNKHISVYGANWLNRSSDGFLGLPVSGLGTNYIVLSYSVSVTQSQFMVVATANNTRVTIQTNNKMFFSSSTFESGETITLTLNDLESAHFGSFLDLTGTRESSNKPVAVFSGVNCAVVPAGKSFCDHLVVQLPPVDEWGYKFVTSPLAQRTRGDLIRILAAYDNTHVRSEWQRGWADVSLHAGQYRDESIASGSPCQVSCNKPCFVVQYSKGDFDQSSHIIPDPFMMIVPPVNQYQSEYELAVPQPRHVPFTTYISIIIPSKDATALMIDNAPSSISWMPIANTSYSRGVIVTQSDFHNLRHKNVPFYASVYGFSIMESYGFSGGWAGRKDDCVKESDSFHCKPYVPTDETPDNRGGTWVKIILLMTAEEWNFPKFQLSIATSFNEQCRDDNADNLCVRLLSHKQTRKETIALFQPKDVLLRAKPKEFSNLLLEVEMSVNTSWMSSKKMQTLLFGDLVGLLQDTAPLISEHLGGIEILFIDGKFLPETVELVSTKREREGVSVVTIVSVIIITVVLVAGLVFTLAFLKRLKEKRSRPQSPYERVSIRYGPPSSPSTPPLEHLPNLDILSPQSPTRHTPTAPQIMVPNEALYAEGHFSVDYASLKKGTMAQNSYAKLNPMTMDAVDQAMESEPTVPGHVYTIPVVQLPEDSSHSSEDLQRTPEALPSPPQPSCEGAANNTGFLLDVKFQTYTSIPRLEFLQPAQQHTRSLSSAGSEKSTDNLYLEVLDDHSSLA